MSVRTLFRPDLSNLEMKQRAVLVHDGASFHIRRADVAVTQAGQAKLGIYFDPANIRLSQVRTLADLATAYASWSLTAPDTERQRLRLRAGKGCIPPESNNVQRLERRVLLTLAAHLDIGDVDIELTPAGLKGWSEMCSWADIAPASLITLAALARLPEEAIPAKMARLGFPVGA